MSKLFRTMINFNSPQNRAQNNYSVEEKMGIIQEYLTTDISMDRISRKYRIGSCTISKWMRIFGIPMPNAASVQNIMAQDTTTKDTPVSNESLEARLKALQTELDREKLKNLALTTMIEVAEEELHIDIRKRAGAKQ